VKVLLTYIRRLATMNHENSGKGPTLSLRLGQLHVDRTRTGRILQLSGISRSWFYAAKIYLAIDALSMAGWWVLLEAHEG